MVKYSRTYCKKSISPGGTRHFVKGNLYYYYVENRNTNGIWIFEDIYKSDIGYRFYSKTEFGVIEYLFNEYFMSERKSKLLKINNNNEKVI